MTYRGFGARGVAQRAIAGAAMLGVTALTGMVGADKFATEIALLADDGWIMGGTSIPTPDATYISEVEARYLQPSPPLFPGQPTFDQYTYRPLTTPEEMGPVIGTLPFNESVAQGVTDLDNAIGPQLQNGDNVSVFGYSQSATISGIEMQHLDPSGTPSPDNLSFVLMADPNNPDGGLLERFDGITFPFINVLANGATPTDDFPTTIYTAEYDGFADFPQYPLNILADINALIGLGVVHPAYPTLDNVGSAIDLGTAGQTTFYMIPENLPLLWPIYEIPYAGPVMADIISPELSWLIDLGYGNPEGGWSPDPGVDGTIGFIPKMDPLQVISSLQQALVQSFVKPINDGLTEGGQAPLPAIVTEIGQWMDGYYIVNGIDTAFREGLTELSQLPGLSILNPDVLFDGQPLISGAPLLDLLGPITSLFNDIPA